MNQAAIIYTMLTGVIGSLCLLAGVLYTAARKGRSDDAAAAGIAKGKSDDAAASIKVALVNDRDSWESRMVARMTGLEQDLDEERRKRRDLEDKGQLNKLKIAELDNEVQTLKREKVIAIKDWQDRTVEQDLMNHRLQDELTALQAKYETLQTEYEELLKVCNELRKQLQNERGQVADDIITIAKSVGSGEGPPAKRHKETPQ